MSESVVSESVVSETVVSETELVRDDPRDILDFSLLTHCPAHLSISFSAMCD